MTLEIDDDWEPTAANVDALPMPLRRYIMKLATHSDPDMTIQENYELRSQVRALEAMVIRLRDEASSDVR